MRSYFRTARLLALLVGLAFLAPLRAQAPAVAAKPDNKTKTKFLRIQRDDQKNPLALETATVRYVPTEGKGVEVDLIGVVHVGDKDYYQKLNKQMEQYDVVLFELVAPAGAKIPKGGRPNDGGPLAMIQQLAKRMLELELQLEQIDYTKANFVHADLSPQEMGKVIKERGDDGFTIALGIMADFMRQQNMAEAKDAKGAAPAGDIDVALLLLDPNRGVKLKRMMAEQFEQLDDPDSGFGKTINQILVKDRNKACLKVMQQQMAKGHKKIGIFYGAAHMPDFEKRLKEDFALKRDKEEWLPAWNLKASKKAGIEDLLKLLLDE